ncbi:MAG: glycoside hydrolase family 2 protein [Planctomycetia bacterium]|nr:glycoside hydrolase family 2 protein [Planctomycetia bacterium]
MNVLACEVADGTHAAGMTNGLRLGTTFAAWTCTPRAAGSIAHPDQLDDASDDRLPSTVPGTVASALAAAGDWDFAHPTDLDAQDWWFRTTFASADVDLEHPCRLCFDGLAGLAQVWLNGKSILTSDNMFRAYRVDVTGDLQPENELVVVFRSLTEELKRKRPRPRWKTNLVRNQQLRWQRTSLVGRIPGWAPCAPTIGPWRAVRLESSAVLLERSHITSTLEGSTGVVTVRAHLAASSAPQRATIRVGDVEAPLELQPSGEGWSCVGELRIPSVPRWWPHTHGTPTLLDCELIVADHDAVHHFPSTPIGFRTLEVGTDPGFALRINGASIYCRGGCWTVSDLLSPDGNEAALRHDLELAQAAGANMLRIGGTMNYESETFYRLCDELGLLVWQDFMFANMDYPVEDPAFRANITAEATEQLTRLARHPSVVVYCGNSEIEQQAAMLGLPRELWSNDWFGRHLPELCAAHHPGTTYVPSTPTGGILPFHTHTGITHYYGVGAYLRPAGDVRSSDVKFTSECLGFANMPEPATIFAVTGGNHPVMHDPTWKQRVPRDGGAGWDFEDVRDHYLRELYQVDPAQLRSFDMPRYLELSRAVSGELMARAFAEWRSTRSHNAGGLIWFYKDLWPGAGWGFVDATGLPKAAYYYLRRSWQTRQLTLTDEGLNGLELHLTNETGEACEATVELTLLKEPNVVVARHAVAVALEPRSQRCLSSDEMLGRFRDLNYAYRFGPPQHDIVVATWFDRERNVVSEAQHFVRRLTANRAATHGVVATAARLDDDTYQVSLSADRYLHTVRLSADGYLPDDNYFYLMPERTKLVTFRAFGTQRAAFRPTLEALNLETDLAISLNAANS